MSVKAEKDSSIKQTEDRRTNNFTYATNDRETVREGTYGSRVMVETECLLPTTGHTPSMITFNCELCNVQCSSEEVFETHLKGQKHQKKVKRKQELEQSGMAEQIRNSDTYCKVCSVELTSKAHMPLHLAGKRHRQNLMKALSTSAADLDVAKSVEEFDKKQKQEEQELIDRAGIKDFSKYAIPAEKKQQALAEGAKNEFYCKLCNKFFTGRTQLAMHIMSARHKEKENPTVRPPKKLPLRRGRRFFDVFTDDDDAVGRTATAASSFCQNSISDLSADFSLPAPKIARLGRNSSSDSYRRGRAYASPDERYGGGLYSRIPMPPPPPLPLKSSFYSTYQSFRAPGPLPPSWCSRSNWQDFCISDRDYWGSPRSEWQGVAREAAAFDHRLNDTGPSRPPHWHSAGMRQPPLASTRTNFYEDCNPIEFDNNFSYRG